MEIHEAAENYLETIYMESLKKEQVRSIDVCNALGYSKPTVSVVMKQFRENGLITIDDNGNISLTGQGLNIAKKMYERHEAIASVLMMIGVDEKTAYHDSCKIEHDISDNTFRCIMEYYKKHK